MFTDAFTLIGASAYLSNCTKQSGHCPLTTGITVRRHFPQIAAARCIFSGLLFFGTILCEPSEMFVEENLSRSANCKIIQQPIWRQQSSLIDGHCCQTLNIFVLLHRCNVVLMMSVCSTVAHLSLNKKLIC